LWRSS